MQIHNRVGCRLPALEGKAWQQVTFLFLVICPRRWRVPVQTGQTSQTGDLMVPGPGLFVQWLGRCAVAATTPVQFREDILLPKQKAAGPASKRHAFESNSRKYFRYLNCPRGAAEGRGGGGTEPLPG